MSLFGGAFLTPVIAGRIGSDLSWRWNFNFIAIFTGCAVILVFFFVPETAFKRDRRLEIDLNGNISQETVSGPLPSEVEDGQNDDAEKNGVNSSSRGLPSQQPIPAKKSYWRTLALFSGRKTDERFYKLVLRPFPLFLQPGVAWSCLIQGVTIGWTVFIGVVFGIMFNGPPLFWSQVKVGYMYSGAFIGSFVGLAVAGLFTDPSTKFLARRNHGIYEPEFRILLVIFQLIFTSVGLFGLAFSADNPTKYGQYPSIAFFGFVTAGMVVGAVASTSYVVDAHRDIAIEGLTCLLVFKNMFSYALTYKAMNWILQRDILGKRNRSFFHRHDVLKMLHLW
ncbi:hypothetical protein KEM54_006331 [Ascosphaera aggregata]|nr:hypothetical protein KEM54_006331 [Ascosphaera aggregata]